MSDTPSNTLADFLRDRLGDDLRSVFHYCHDECHIVYVRDDVVEAYAPGEISDVVEDARLEAVDKPRQEDLYVHGGLRCTVRLFEDAVELHFPHDETCGTAVALDRESLSLADGVVGECLELLVESPDRWADTAVQTANQ